MDGGSATGASWSTWREMADVLTQPQQLRRIVVLVLVVGTAFVAMNQLGTILAGLATPLVWFKAVLTYVTPLLVSSISVLSATHRPTGQGTSGSKDAAASVNQGGDE